MPRRADGRAQGVAEVRVGAVEHQRVDVGGTRRGQHGGSRAHAEADDRHVTDPASPGDGYRSDDVVLLACPEGERIAAALALVAQIERHHVEAVGDEVRGEAQRDPAHEPVAVNPRHDDDDTAGRPRGDVYQPRRIVPSSGLGKAMSS